jgi:hypothetical protein
MEMVVKALTEGKWTHDYPILIHQIIEWGLPIRTDMPEEVYALMDLYPHDAAPSLGPVYPDPLPTRRRTAPEGSHGTLARTILQTVVGPLSVKL